LQLCEKASVIAERQLVKQQPEERSGRVPFSVQVLFLVIL
jgi:hypothetical protein